MVAARWQSGAWPDRPGRHEALDIADEPTYYPTETGLEELRVQANIEIEEVLFLGHTPITSIKGFRDEIDGATLTDEFETAEIDFRDVERDWRRLASPDELPTPPMLTLHARTAFPRLSQ